MCADLRGYGNSSKPKRLPDNSNYSFRAHFFPDALPEETAEVLVGFLGEAT